ncbi:hypothetical protein [Thalassomonas actiniarum]|uniref:Uncharacterized protein n=1 Tax=Thalassomonas actiniarum TaxID=485447 RepID=A0AAE9Z018_9GAMM|nr:hypothetical protein [Thalassomonas actiniarum]WDE02693.1 hypothetical protein SG35_030295 [Thalassomonas actiniarum]
MANLLSVLCLFFILSPAYGEKFKIALSQNTPDQKVAAQVPKVIYQRLGIAVVFVELPGKRALVESSSGNLDAEAQRIYRIGELYPDLLRVPTSYMTWGVSAFSKSITSSLPDNLPLKAMPLLWSGA